MKKGKSTGERKGGGASHLPEVKIVAKGSSGQQGAYRKKIKAYYEGAVCIAEEEAHLEE